MYNITFISTVHKEMGKCNADELCKILIEIRPEVIFLEALEETYTKHESYLFRSYRNFHKKLEICAIQKYYYFNASYDYVPVLDVGLSDAFEKKYSIVCENVKFQKLLDNFNSLAKEDGFQFLNSNKSIRLHEDMRILESTLLNGSDIHKVNDDIDAYENSMIRNIYSYCRDNRFNSAVFLCGDAHRKSIIQKIERHNVQEEINLNWIIYEN